MENPSVLIIGGSGLLAVNWAQAMRDRYDLTLGLHNRYISLAKTFSKEINLESVDELMLALEELNCKVVVNTSGLANVEQCESDPALAFHVNVVIASNVAKACAGLGIKLVHISTDHLFSGQDPMVGEDHFLAPVNVYGKTKAEAEYWVSEINPDSLIIRTNFYGRGTSYRHSFSDIIINELRSHHEIVLFQDVSYTPVLIEYAAKVIHELIDLKVSGIFHVVGDDCISKYEFGLRIAEKFGLNSSNIIPGYLSNRSSLIQRPFDMSLSNSKVRNLLGRSVGGVDEQIERLCEQEFMGHSKELQKL